MATVKKDRKGCRVGGSDDDGRGMGWLPTCGWKDVTAVHCCSLLCLGGNARGYPELKEFVGCRRN